MAERKATNKYYPPEWEPSQGSINTFKKSHPLRARAKKLDEGILVVRGRIVIATDPAAAEYVILEGARRRVEEFDPEDVGLVALKSKEEEDKLQTSAFYKLEHDEADKKRAQESKGHLAKLMDLSDARNEDPFAKSQLLRKRLRDGKKAAAHQASLDAALTKTLQVGVPLLSASTSDSEAAKRIDWQKQKFEKDRADKNSSLVFGSGLLETGNVSGKTMLVNNLGVMKRRQLYPFSVIISQDASTRSSYNASQSTVPLVIRKGSEETLRRDALGSIVAYSDSDGSASS